MLQPLDVGINKPFKDRVRHLYMMWAAENMIGRDKVPSPGREIVLQWVAEAWSEITPIVGVRVVFGYGYVISKLSNQRAASLKALWIVFRKDWCERGRKREEHAEAVGASEAVAQYRV